MYCTSTVAHFSTFYILLYFDSSLCVTLFPSPPPPPPPSPPLDWYIESEPQAADILLRTDVSFNNGRSATIDAGVLYVDSTPLANLSDIISLTDGVSAASMNRLSFEPKIWHFCNVLKTLNNSYQ